MGPPTLSGIGSTARARPFMRRAFPLRKTFHSYSPPPHPGATTGFVCPGRDLFCFFYIPPGARGLPPPPGPPAPRAMGTRILAWGRPGRWDAALGPWKNGVGGQGMLASRTGRTPPVRLGVSRRVRPGPVSRVTKKYVPPAWFCVLGCWRLCVGGQNKNMVSNVGGVVMADYLDRGKKYQRIQYPK